MEREKDSVSLKNMALAGAVLAAFIGIKSIGCVDRISQLDRLKYDRSLVVERVVQEGDTIDGCAKSEGTNINKRNYLGTMQRINDFYLPNGRHAIGEHGEIYAGSKLLFPDIDYNRKVCE